MSAATAAATVFTQRFVLFVVTGRLEDFQSAPLIPALAQSVAVAAVHPAATAKRSLHVKDFVGLRSVGNILSQPWPATG